LLPGEPADLADGVYVLRDLNIPCEAFGKDQLDQ
jgi:hypothetical protein